jgi:hypothetical protein
MTLNMGNVVNASVPPKRRKAKTKLYINAVSESCTKTEGQHSDKHAEWT